jgi:carboxypeptidase family protein
MRLIDSFILLVSLGVSMYAQEFRGTVLGRVVDASNAVVPSAAITVTNTATNTSVNTQTGADGSYLVPFLIPGFYRVTAEAAGFKKAVREGIEVRVQDRLTVDLTLQVGATSESVEVTASAALLETSTATIGQVIENRQLVSMPLNGRSAYLLARLAPGVLPTDTRTFTRPFDNGAISNSSLSGNRGKANEVLLDGISNVGADNTITFTPSIDATQEFKVQTNTYDAEFGRSAGGVINVTVKSGANQVHGSLFEFFRNNALDANNFFNNRVGAQKAPLHYNQFGVSVGGPAYLPKVYNGKDRTFFFFNYEAIRQLDGRSYVGAVPMLKQRDGDFSATFAAPNQPIQIYDPFSTRADPARAGSYLRDPFPGNRIPTNRWDPVAKAALAYFPVPNAPGNALTGADNLFYSNGTPDGYDAVITRIDHQISNAQRIFGRFSWSQRPRGDDNYFGNIADSNFTAANRSSRGAALDYVNTLTPRWLLNLRWGFSRYADPTHNPSEGFDITTLGFPSAFRNQTVFRMYPRFEVSGLTNMGRDGGSNPTEDTQTFQASLTHIRGAHTLKLGGDFRVIRQNQFSAGYGSGRFAFSRAYTQGPDPLRATTTGGNALASFLLGTPSSGSVEKAVALSFQNLYGAAFAQDDIKVTRKLTLNVGLRWEHEGARTERYNRMTRGFAFGQPNPLQVPGLKLQGGLLYAGVGGQPRGQSDTYWNKFAPRFGFAYSLSSKTVLRGGYGVFWSGTTDIGAGTNAAPGFSATTNFVSSLDNITPLNVLRNPFPDPLLVPLGSSQGLATLVGQGVSFTDIARRIPYAEQYSFGIQHQLGAGTLIEAAYVGNRGIALANSNVELDQLPDSVLSMGSALLDQVTNPFYGIISSGALASRTVARGQLLRPYAQYSGVTVLSPTIGSSTYHSFQLKVEKRFSRGLSLLASYTNAKIIDDIGNPQNNNNLRAERSISTLDRPQRLVISEVWEIPIGKGRALGRSVPTIVDMVIGGWQMNCVAIFQRGQILGVTSSTNTTNSLGGRQRPNSTGKSAELSPASKDDMLSRYFDTSVFGQPAPFTFGNLARTLPDVRGPGTNNFDISVVKAFRIREGFKAQFRGEFFNAWNRTEFANPGTTQGTAQFGVISGISNSANPSRQVQLALKLIF